MTESDRFQDNSSGVITDNKNKKHWLPKDSWGDLGQWRNFNEATCLCSSYESGLCGWIQ